MRKTWYFIWLILLPACWIGAQTGPLSTVRQRLLLPRQDSAVRLDSLIVIPSSVRVTGYPTGESIDTGNYRIANNRLYWNQLPDVDTVKVSYRILPYDLGQAFQHLDTNLVRSPGDSIPLAYNPFAQQDPLIDFKGLDYNGTFARGLSFGNNQDLVLNSSFNLQLAGDLGEGVEILAAISDENIPLQPEGNTQQLQEFDKIFVQLKKEDNRLIAGDYELQRPDSYFMNYFKKLQGATFSNKSSLGKGVLQTDASVAIARGQFARNTISGEEGNQGPYKLRGSQGERFIIILSGTEKVWLDGQLLQRGLEEDYIIDYNRGELTFTNRRLITKDSRIIVEFDYSDQNYLRSLYAFNSEYEQNRFRFYVNLLNQQDSKTSTGNQDLSDEEKRILAGAGDNTSLAVAPGIDTLEEFSPFRAMYIASDTLLDCGRRDTIYIYSTDSEKARLTVRFSFVGAGNGNYVLDQEQVANERIYRWVAPDPATCDPRGSYAPVIQLIAPQRQMLLTTGGEYRIGEAGRVRTEIAFSHNDLNRFSSLDNADDNGMALLTEFNNRFQLGPKSEGWQLTTELGYEMVQQNFRALNPYRNPEFLRDWSLADKQGLGAVQPAREQLLHSGLRLERPGTLGLYYRLSAFLRDSLFQGLQHFTSVALQRGGLEIKGQGSFVDASSPSSRSRFLRPRLTITQQLPWMNNWQVGVYGEMEKNDRYDERADTLSQTSFYYHLLRSFLRSPETGKLQVETNLTRRQDYQPVNGGFERSTLAHEFNINGNWQAARSFRLRTNFTYRHLALTTFALPGPEAGETFLGRTDASLTLFKGALRSTTTYEIGAGQEPALEFTFIKVNKGEGTHIWLDSLYNNDGVVQPNEMEIAPFPDQADFVRVTTFTDSFIRTNSANINQSLQLNPKAVWYNQTGLRRFLARFSTQSSFKINRKTQDAPGISPWNPFQLNIADTALVAVSSNIRNVLFFNRADPKYDIQLGMQDNSSKLVQTSGFESRRRLERFIRSRWNINTALSTQLALSTGQRISDSEFFDTKDYQLTFFTLEPQLTFLPSKNFRTILRYRYQWNENTLIDKGESALQHDLNLEATYNRSATSSIRLSLSYVNIQFNGRANSPVGFAILNGLSPGRNFLWNLGLDRQVAQNIQLRLSYEGRKTGTAGVVHTGRAQVAATF